MAGNENAMLDLVLSAYVEPCRICGGMVTKDDLKTAVFAGYGRKESDETPVTRVAHQECWNLRKDDQSTWVYPIDG